MGRIKGLFLLGLTIMLSITGCRIISAEEERPEQYMKRWLKEAGLEREETKEELYEKALKEDTIVVYTISTRITEVKRSFEEEYPGLTVEVVDIRGSEIIELVTESYETMKFDCDVIICNDNNRELYQQLIEPEIIYSYLPYDIAPKMKEGYFEEQLYFLGEAQMLFYNNWDEPPIRNWWELTEERFYGKIYAPNPFRSFSTYGLYATILASPELMAEAYESYSNKELVIPEGKTASEVFLERLFLNMHVTNTSDEVVETIAAPGQTEPVLGIMISSKLRMREIGYRMEPFYQLEPFAGTYCPNTVAIAGGSRNVNGAKLFIRWLLGETDGTGEGLIPYRSEGTWSVRTDTPDGNAVPLNETTLIWQDKTYISEHRNEIDEILLKMMSEISME